MKPDSGIAKNKSQRQKKEVLRCEKSFVISIEYLVSKFGGHRYFQLIFGSRDDAGAQARKKKCYAGEKKIHQCNEKVKSLRTYFTVYNYIVGRVALGWLLINRRQTLSCKTPIWPTFWYLDVVVVGSLLTIGIDYETNKPFFSFKRFPSSR